MPFIDVPCDGDVRTIFEASVTGTGPIWADGSDATYATINPTSGQAQGGFQESPPVRYRPSMTVAALVKWSGPTPNPFVVHGGYGNVAARDSSQPVTDAGGGWRLIPLAYVDSDRTWIENLVEAFLGLGTPGGGTVTAFEASLRFTWKPTEAPPRRLYPRSDGLGVSGGRRHWPPPNSRQRGLRRGPGGFI